MDVSVLFATLPGIGLFDGSVIKSTLTGIGKIVACVVSPTLPGIIKIKVVLVFEIGKMDVSVLFANKKAGAINSGTFTQLK